MSEFDAILLNYDKKPTSDSIIVTYLNDYDTSSTVDYKISQELISYLTKTELDDGYVSTTYFK